LKVLPPIGSTYKASANTVATILLVVLYGHFYFLKCRIIPAGAAREKARRANRVRRFARARRDDLNEKPG
jgi:hypothetical protein